MKKIYVSILVVLLFSSIGFASDNTNTTAGDTLTVADESNTSSAMTFDPSPGVILNCFTSASAYSINGVNTSATAGSRMEYLMRSVDSGYYQKKADSAADLTATDQAVDGYTQMGGGTAEEAEAGGGEGDEGGEG